MSRARRSSPHGARSRDAGASAVGRRWNAAALVLGFLIVVTALAVDPWSKEAFRTIKGLLGGWLALGALAVALVASRRTTGARRGLADAHLAIAAVAPLALVAVVSRLLTPHQAHARESTADLLIGLACLAGWSATLPAATLLAALRVTIPVGALVAALLLDQAWGAFGLLDGLGVQAPTTRLALTSTLGNPGDVGAYLVLPCLLVVQAWPSTTRQRRMWLGGALALMLVALAVTATVVAILALVAASAVWMVAVPTYRLRAGALAVVATLALATLPPVRARVASIGADLARGDLNAALTGRLDGWRAAVEMTRRHPLTGVGQGAFRAAYADTRLALIDRGVPVLPTQDRVMFATPHNEWLSVAAELGAPGVVALLWGVLCLAVALRRMPAGWDRQFAVAGVSAVAVLATAWFPMHAPAVAWPLVMLLAWLVAAGAAAAPPVGEARRWAALALAALALAALVVVALAWQTRRVVHRVQAGHLLALVEARTREAIARRRVPSTLFNEHFLWLDRARRLDPLEVGVPMARGAQFLLLRRGDDALAAYQEAASLEPRPEIELNIGRAHVLRGDSAAAREAFGRAVRLSPVLASEVPPEFQPSARP